MFGPHFRSALPVTLPEADSIDQLPTLSRYIAAYFASINKPVPAMTDMVREGILSASNRVEVLYVAIDKSTWVNAMLWIEWQFENAIRQSDYCRCYAARVSERGNVLFTEVIRGKRYIALLSTPYEAKEQLRIYTRDLWKLDVPSLSLEPDPEPIAIPAPIVSQTAETQPARAPRTPRPLTPPTFTRPQGHNHE
jgi:hypothetical protein